MSNICGGKDSHSQCQEGSYFKTATSVGKDVEKLETLHTVGGSVKWCSHYGNQYGVSSRNLKKNYHMVQQSLFCIFV